jgi:hypothetical protein
MRPAQRTMLGLLAAFILAFTASAKAQRIAAEDVIGAYTCSSAIDPPHNLYLLPNGRWDLSGPFSRQRLSWISVQSRGWRGRFLYQLDPQGIFKVEPGLVRLYNEEPVDEMLARCAGSCRPQRSFLKVLQRPSSLPTPQRVWDTRLVRAFQVDSKSGQLDEMLSSGSLRTPLRCQRHSLFAPRMSLGTASSY